MNHWLIKSEPAAYSWDDLNRDGETLWDGVRNHRAAINLRAMRAGDQVFFYHSVTGKEIVGIAEVSEADLTDPRDDKWPAVKVKPVTPVPRPVTLAAVKANKALAEIELVRLSRLSVAEIKPAEWATVCSMAGL
ncbi:MAG: ubiquinol-cytochrome C reductase [Sphingomonadales bacterium 32-68-7]|nr:MAG: ubiquinol-cytochrome C reductase [Sphingomonadales bacterium 12-68-11]OYX06847.1 MAG: ubiquinol-cytochrome C reductase [Sphingomonadales bacterium 32-68-7]